MCVWRVRKNFVDDVLLWYVWICLCHVCDETLRRSVEPDDYRNPRHRDACRQLEEKHTKHECSHRVCACVFLTSCPDFEYRAGGITPADGQDGHIECAATEIVDENILIALQPFLETVGECCSRGLVDDT